VLRIAVGALFLVFGGYKVFGTEFVFGGGFQGWIQRFLVEGAYPFMVPVLRGFVLPHAHPFALLVAYGELALGVSLVLGAWVRPAGLCGLVYMFALLFSANYPGPDAVRWQWPVSSLVPLRPLRGHGHHTGKGRVHRGRMQAAVVGVVARLRELEIKGTAC
jgi:uncharacterized membrane protein YphA (DoxX/SURF4 family)